MTTQDTSSRFLPRPAFATFGTRFAQPEKLMAMTNTQMAGRNIALSLSRHATIAMREDSHLRTSSSGWGGDSTESPPDVFLYQVLASRRAMRSRFDQRANGVGISAVADGNREVAAEPDELRARHRAPFDE